VDPFSDDLRMFVAIDLLHTRLDLAGEIDLSNSQRLADQLATIAGAGAADLEIDMSLVTFCDSTGLKVLLNAQQRFDEAGGTLRIIGASDQVTRLLQITGTADTLGANAAVPHS
jgi:anti-sigma B factor antagonist